MAPLLPTMISKSPTFILSLDGGSVPTKSGKKVKLTQILFIVSIDMMFVEFRLVDD